MSSLLSSYETEFKTTFDEIVHTLSTADKLPLQQRNSTLSTVEQQKDELLDLVDQMDIEVNNSVTDPGQRANLKSKLRDYKKQIQLKIKIPLQNLQDSRDRATLFGNVGTSDTTTLGAGAGTDNLSEEQRQQLLSNHQLLNKTGDKLRDASRIAHETEGIGSQIMMDLRAQRETLENSRQTLFQADSYVDRSMRTLKVMSRRLVANKLISYAIIAVLILLILLVLFSKFR